MADVLQDLSLESDFLQQLLSAGAEVALAHRLRTDKQQPLGRGSGPKLLAHPAASQLSRSASTKAQS